MVMMETVLQFVQLNFSFNIFSQHWHTIQGLAMVKSNEKVKVFNKNIYPIQIHRNRIHPYATHMPI